MVPTGKKKAKSSTNKTNGNAPAAKPGGKDHFLGDQWTFLNKDGPSFIITQSDKKISIGKFYDNKTRAFVADFGVLPDTPEDAAARMAPPAATPETAEEILVRRANGIKDPPPPETEAQRNARIDSSKFSRLREKIAQWYRHHWLRNAGSVANAAPTAATDATEVAGCDGGDGHEARTGVSGPTPENPFLAALGISLGKRPRRVGAFHYYQRVTYKTTMVAEYNRRFTAAKMAYDALSEQAQEAKETPKAVKIRTELAKQFWCEEPEEVRARFTVEAEEEYEREMEEWEATQMIPKTPLQYHQQLEFAPQYLRPLLEVISAQMGAAVSIAIIGPVASEGGNIQVRGAHINWSGGIAASTWATHDPVGYVLAISSMVAYGRSCFTLAECQSRALASTTIPPNTVTDTPALTTPSPALREPTGPSHSPSPSVEEPTGPIHPMHPSTPDSPPTPVQEPAQSNHPRPPPVEEPARPIDHVHLLTPVNAHTHTLELANAGPIHPVLLSAEEQRTLTYAPTPGGVPVPTQEPDEPISPTTQVEEQPSRPHPPLLPPPSGTPAVQPWCPVSSPASPQAEELPSRPHPPLLPPPSDTPAVQPWCPVSSPASPQAEELPSRPRPPLPPPPSNMPAVQPQGPVTSPTSPQAEEQPSRPRPPLPLTPSDTPAIHPGRPVSSLLPLVRPEILGISWAPFGNTQQEPLREEATIPGSSRLPLPFPAHKGGASSWPKLQEVMGSERVGARPRQTSPNHPTLLQTAQQTRQVPTTPTPSVPPKRPVPRKKVILTLLPPDAPENMVLAYQFFTNDPLEVKGQSGRTWGPDWTDCVNSWVAFQGLNKYRDVGLGYSATLRPAELTEWLSAGRPWEHLHITSPSAFALVWWKWWESLQPSERVHTDVESDTLIAPTAQMDWWTVAKQGRAGFMMVMVALTWWGKASRTNKPWKAAVQEVVAVMACVLEWRKSQIQGEGAVKKVGTLRTVSSVDVEDSPRQSKRLKTIRSSIGT